MQDPFTSAPGLRVPWYWAPYVLYLGAVDYWQECQGVTHRQAVASAVSAVKTQRHRIFRVVSSAILLAALGLLVVQRVLAPWLAGGGLAPSAPVMLWSALALAFTATLLIPYLLTRRLWRGLLAFYGRGLGVLERRGKL